MAVKWNEQVKTRKAQEPSPMPGAAPGGGSGVAMVSQPTGTVKATPMTDIQKEAHVEMAQNTGLPMTDNQNLANAQMAIADKKVFNPQKPVLQTIDPKAALESQRNNYLQSFNTWAEAEKAGNISQREWANARIQQMIAEGKDPGRYETILSLMGDAETPEEKRRRERNEALGETFRGLGNLIGNAANLYYTHRGGQYIDLNSVHETHRERMQRIKDKQDALAEQTRRLLLDGKLKDLSTAREAKEKAAERAFKLKVSEVKTKADKEAAELKYKQQLLMKDIDNALKMGQIEAQAAADMKRDAAKAASAKELEAVRQANRLALKQTPGYGEDKVVDSAVGADGNIYTRNSKLTDNEAMQIVQSHVADITPFVTRTETGQVDANNQPIYNERVDWRAAAAYALQKGLVSVEDLEQMGFKPGKRSSKKSLPGVPKQSNKKGKHLNL